jgi:hypothetical protein
VAVLFWDPDMAEVLRTKQSNELTQTFLQFVLMQTQQALFAMGKHPKMPPNPPPPNLELAKMYVDHLVMLRFKTEGNLQGDELNALNNAITHLQNAYVEALKEAGK